MDTQKIEAEGNELILKNKEGDYVIIPKKDRNLIKSFINRNCNSCIDIYVSKLPIIDDYAEDGGLINADNDPDNNPDNNQTNEQKQTSEKSNINFLGEIKKIYYKYKKNIANAIEVAAINTPASFEDVDTETEGRKYYSKEEVSNIYKEKLKNGYMSNVQNENLKGITEVETVGDDIIYNMVSNIPEVDIVANTNTKNDDLFLKDFGFYRKDIFDYQDKIKVDIGDLIIDDKNKFFYSEKIPIYKSDKYNDIVSNQISNDVILYSKDFANQISSQLKLDKDKLSKAVYATIYLESKFNGPDEKTHTDYFLGEKNKSVHGLLGEIFDEYNIRPQSKGFGQFKLENNLSQKSIENGGITKDILGKIDQEGLRASTYAVSIKLASVYKWMDDYFKDKKINISDDDLWKLAIIGYNINYKDVAKTFKKRGSVENVINAFDEESKNKGTTFDKERFLFTYDLLNNIKEGVEDDI